MDRVCTSCAQRVLRAQKLLLQGTRIGGVRGFTTSLNQRADDAPKSSSSGPNIIRKVVRDKPTAPSTTGGSINRIPQGGQLLRRTSQPQRTPATKDNGSPQGALLRRTETAPPRQFVRRPGPPQQGGRTSTGASGARQGRDGQMRRRKTDKMKAKNVEEKVPENVMKEYVDKYIDPPANPTTSLMYNPKPQELIELEKDWPNTPLSATGLSASMVQKIEWLARRIPHGYHTPGQLAEHFQQGNLTRFESEEEKQQVLKIAVELAQKRATQLSERKGSEVPAEDMTMVDLSSRNEKKKLVGEVVKGEITELERQRMPFLESVMRNLQNNQTYHKTEMDSFMATVQKLMPAQAQRRPQQQPQKSS